MNLATRRESRHAAVVVLDTNPILAAAMCAHVASSGSFERGDVVGLTWDRAAELASFNPDILVLDPAEVPTDLEAYVAGMRAVLPDMHLIAYSSDATLPLARLCMGLGFRGFVPKTAESVQLMGALSVVAKGGMYVHKSVAGALKPLAVDPVLRGVETLSAREEAILRRISLGLSHKQIAAELSLSPKTIDTYRARGMRKIGLTDRVDLVRVALKRGWFEQDKTPPA